MSAIYEGYLESQNEHCIKRSNVYSLGVFKRMHKTKRFKSGALLSSVQPMVKKIMAFESKVWLINKLHVLWMIVSFVKLAHEGVAIRER